MDVGKTTKKRPGKKQNRLSKELGQATWKGVKGGRNWGKEEHRKD